MVVFGAIYLLLLLFITYLYSPVISDPSFNYFQRKGKLLDISKNKYWRSENSDYHEIQLTSTSGLKVQLTVRTPINIDTPRPLLIALGGQRSGGDGARFIPDTQGVILAVLSYNIDKDTNKSTFNIIKELPNIQQAIIDSPPAVSLALDYLLTLPSVDTDHVELAGVSLGAFMVSVAGALDTRFQRVWLIQGAAEPDKVFEHNLKSYIKLKPLRKLAAHALAVLVAAPHLKPEKWLSKISPRKVMLVNARNDEMLPASCINVLHQAAREPFEIIWIPGPHVTTGRREVINDISTIVFGRLSEK